jgi:NDP-sugar pyrophosphorylase family protein
VGEDAHIERSILLPDAVVEPGARVIRSILGEGAVVEAGATLGSEDGPITVIGDNQHITVS